MSDKGFENVNSEAILAVRDVAIFENDRFDMRDWGLPIKGLEETNGDIEACNTVGCMAGHALIYDGWTLNVRHTPSIFQISFVKDDMRIYPYMTQFYTSDKRIILEAADILGVPIGEANSVFTSGGLSNKEAIYVLEKWAKGESVCKEDSDEIDWHKMEEGIEDD